MRIVLTLTFVGVFTCICSAQTAPDIEWQTCFGTSMDQEGHSVGRTADGGYILAGATFTGPDSWDYYIIKLDASGAYEWDRSYGGSGIDKAHSIQQTNDDGYILAGITTSSDGDISEYYGQSDIWVVKLDADGDLQWQRSLGGTAAESGTYILQSNEGGYIVAGWTESNDGDVSMNHGQQDVWVVKLDTSGELEWERSYGGSDREAASSIELTNDGGFILAGSTRSTDGDVTEYLGDWDMWILKLDGTGAIEWQNSLGGSGEDGASSIQQTTDGGYIVSGSTNSNDGDVDQNQGSSDYWAVKLLENGEIEWQKTYGGPSSDVPRTIEQTGDGGYIIAGSTNSSSGDITNYNGGWFDQWVVRLDQNGTLLWEKAMGGSADDRVGGMCSSPDGGYVVVGFSNSDDGDVTSLFPGYDLWVIKLAIDPTAIIETGKDHSIFLYPNPATDALSISFAIDDPSFTVIQIVNSTGQLMMDILNKNMPVGEQKLHISMEALPVGVYYVHAISAGATSVSRFVKL